MINFILVAVITNTSLGEFNSLIACESAIYSRITAPLAVSSLSSPLVQRAISAAVQIQQEFICLPVR
jgi:hypothetical protein